MGELDGEERPTGFTHSRNSPVPVPAALELIQINQSSEGGHQALTPPTTSSETVNAAAPDISTMASNLDVGRNLQVAENSLEKSPDIVELGTSGKLEGDLKRKMNGSDREGDTTDHDGESKIKRIKTVEEEDPDIICLGSWKPPQAGKSRKKDFTRTAVKMENLPIKLENPVSDSNVSVKTCLIHFFIDVLPTSLGLQVYYLQL